MNENLNDTMVDYIYDNLHDLSYEVTAELAVIYATRVDKTYRELFFSRVRNKFIKELKYLKEETLYKILWSLLKADQLKITDNSAEWCLIKDMIKLRSKELSPKVLSDIFLLSTMEGATRQDEQRSADLFSSLEADLILKMKAMSLDDLINLMWASLEIERGSTMFY